MINVVKRLSILFACWLFCPVVIIDPGIKTEDGYQPYTDGLQMDVFVKVDRLDQSCQLLTIVCADVG